MQTELRMRSSACAAPHAQLCWQLPAWSLCAGRTVNCACAQVTSTRRNYIILRWPMKMAKIQQTEGDAVAGGTGPVEGKVRIDPWRVLSHWGGAGDSSKAPLVLVALYCCYRRLFFYSILFFLETGNLFEFDKYSKTIQILSEFFFFFLFFFSILFLYFSNLFYLFYLFIYSFIFYSILFSLESGKLFEFENVLF